MLAPGRWYPAAERPKGAWEGEDESMTQPFGDRLVAAIEAKRAPACVGLDPVLERLPQEIRPEVSAGEGVDPAAAAALEKFCLGVIEASAPLIPVVKVNIAFFERYHAPGVAAYYRVVRAAQKAGLLVIGDVKRADIGHSAAQYAQAQLAPIEDAQAHAGATPDAVTLNPYLGYDTIAPFAEIARAHGRGIFVLVQTSNPSAVELQGLALKDGRPFCVRVAELVQEWAQQEGLIGASGYSAIGAVVSPGAAADTGQVRAAMPNCIFLVPGFGAQGRSADDVRGCFKPDGLGALVTASRSVIYAYENESTLSACGGDWRRCVKAGAREFVDALRRVTSS